MDKQETSHIEQAPIDNPKGTDKDATRLDKEVQEYSQTAIEVDEPTSRRLRTLIDRRVLVIMIITYFLQALDKGTMSFASIMGIREQTNLQGQEYSWLTTCIYIAVLAVEYPTNWVIQRVPIAKYLGAMCASGEQCWRCMLLVMISRGWLPFVLCWGSSRRLVNQYSCFVRACGINARSKLPQLPIGIPPLSVSKD